MATLQEMQSAANVRQVVSRYATKCPQCKMDLPAGTAIGQPQVKNASGGNRFDKMWYCLFCAVNLQKQAGMHLPLIGGVTVLNAPKSVSNRNDDTNWDRTQDGTLVAEMSILEMAGLVSRWLVTLPGGAGAYNLWYAERDTDGEDTFGYRFEKDGQKYLVIND